MNWKMDLKNELEFSIQIKNGTYVISNGTGARMRITKIGIPKGGQRENVVKMVF